MRERERSARAAQGGIGFHSSAWLRLRRRVLTKVTVRVALDRLKLSLEELDLLAQLGVLASRSRARRRAALERHELLLGLDKVEEDVEDAAEDEREEERRAGQVD